MKSKPLPMSEVARLVLDAGFVGWRAVEVVATIWAESRGDAYAINVNDYDPTLPSYLSLDVGLCQFNTYWHPNVSIREALTPAAALAAMHAITGGGRVDKLTLWNAYKSGAYKQFLHDARVAVGI